MWVYFYISERRVAQLAYQINPKIPSELVQKWDVKGAAKGTIEAKTSKIFEVVGLTGKATAAADANTTHTSEKKINTPKEIIIDTVCSYLIEKDNYFFIKSDTTINDLRNIQNLVRFQGLFRPNISGDNVAERSANFWEAKSFYWEGKCGEIDVSFPTTKDSLESATPLIECLEQEDGALKLDGFGTLNTVSTNSKVQILPLFFGMEL